MAQNAFSGGVDPGGLWNQNDIRVLLCYILSSVDGPLSKEDLCEILQGKALANYFESEDALAALETQGHVARTPEGYRITPTGREIARDLDTQLPLTVRDKALEAAVRLLAKARSRRENRVDIAEGPGGFQVTCHISGGGDMDLMSIRLYVPDRAGAQLVEKNFYENPQGVYQLLLAALTGDRSYAEEFFQN